MRHLGRLEEDGTLTVFPSLTRADEAAFVTAPAEARQHSRTAPSARCQPHDSRR